VRELTYKEFTYQNNSVFCPLCTGYHKRYVYPAYVSLKMFAFLHQLILFSDEVYHRQRSFLQGSGSMKFCSVTCIKKFVKKHAAELTIRALE
jgi:hypothetical protein